MKNILKKGKKLSSSEIKISKEQLLMIEKTNQYIDDMRNSQRLTNEDLMLEITI